jgi:hypothetical protein
MIKTLLKNIKNIINDLTRQLNIRNNIVSDLKYIVYETEYKHTFFGYYDKIPFSKNNKKLLAIATDHDDVLTTPIEAAVGYFDINIKNFVEIDRTTTWCWQQGCRLMWFDETSVIYNKVLNNDYGSIVFDLHKNKVVRSFKFAIYDKTSDNKLALSLNFSRLHYFRPGYGYVNFLTEDDKVKIQKGDGIYLCDLESNSKKLIITLENIVNKDYDERMKDAYHYINHLKFSPDNEHFIFYHIWNNDGKRFTRAMLSDLNGNILKVFDNKTFLSHYDFKNENELLIFTKSTQNGYHLYNFKNDTVNIFSPDLQEDGHPTFISDDLVLTDTYPSRFLREQRLIIANKKSYEVIGKFYAPFKYKGEFRCDLHPRFSGDKKLIAIDVPFFDGRKLVVLER